MRLSALSDDLAIARREKRARPSRSPPLALRLDGLSGFLHFQSILLLSEQVLKVWCQIWWLRVLMYCIVSYCIVFIHLCSASLSISHPEALRGSAGYSMMLLLELTRRSMQFTWRVELDSNLRPSGLKAPKSTTEPPRPT